MLNDLINQLHCAFLLCYICHLPIDNEQPICLRCQSYFEKNTLACHRCAMPISSSIDASCGQCQQRLGYIDKTFAFWRYKPPLTNLIHDFKYRNQLFLAPFLANCMLTNMPHPLSQADYFIPMPIHHKRLRTRGFNQASMLGKMLSKKTGIVMNQTICQRKKFNSPQAVLDLKSREKNVQNAFISKPVHQLHLVIIDDILTTGATANSLAKELKQQGAKQVDLWCVARQY